MIAPPRVVFLSSADLLEAVLEKGGRNPGGYGDGRDDADLRAGASRSPSGALVRQFGNSRIEPGRMAYSILVQ